MRVATVALLLTSVASAAGTPTGVDRIAWLQGCWTMTTGERVVEEQWMAPRGGAMLGIGRTVKAGRLVEHEFMIVRERGDALVLEAHPSGQSAAEFVARDVLATDVGEEERLRTLREASPRDEGHEAHQGT